MKIESEIGDDQVREYLTDLELTDPSYGWTTAADWFDFATDSGDPEGYETSFFDVAYAQLARRFAAACREGRGVGTEHLRILVHPTEDVV